MNIFGYQIDLAIAGIVIAVIFGLITLFAWILPRRARLHKSERGVIDHLKQKVETIEREAKEAVENIKLMEEHFGIKPYVDGLTSSPPAVFDPFAKGLKLMTEYKWDEAIVEFKQSMKEAKASELVALYNLIGLCYSTPGKLDLALENWNKSLSLAREFNDKEGEAVVLGNLGNVYQIRGELDKAIKYYKDALKISKDIGKKEGEAKALGNLGNVYRIRGEFDQAIKYYEEGLRIDLEMNRKEGIASKFNNLGSIFKAKGEKEKALKYFEDALKLFTKIGAKREIEMVKENIRKLKGE